MKAVITTLGIALVMLGAALAGQMPSTADQDQRLQAMRSEGAGASLTIAPIVLGDTPSGLPREVRVRVAEVVALFLEQAGMQELEISASEFTPAGDEDLQQVAESFGRFVSEHGIATDYALFGAYLGTVQDGVREVWGVVVDREGRIVWIDRQAPGDEDFDRIEPAHPMSCSILLVERLRTQLGLEDPMREDAPKGKIAALMRQRSGVPEESVYAAMKERRELLKESAGEASLAVYPVRIWEEIDPPSAEKLVELINGEELCKAEMAAEQPHLAVTRDPNEMKILWNLANAFREHLRSNPPDTDYALYADFYIDVETSHVAAVHFVVCDRNGEWVIVDLQNSHQEDFQAVAPASKEGCCQLVARRLEALMQ